MSEDDQFLISMMEGKSKFQGARSRAFWKEIINHLRGKPAELLSFEDIKQKLRLREESYRGLQEVPLDRIAGSVGRYREFTRDFLPKERQMEERWSRVYATANSMTGFPPIELYKIGDVYFVRDGNHRVSVARQLGAKSIEAHVTELPTSVAIDPGMTEQEIHDAAAYAAFLDETGLSKTRPHHHALQLSERLRYSDLLGHIYLHQSLLEHMAGHKISLEQAATDWYDTVYRPAITLIQKYNMKETLGARTEADLYLWLVDHLRDLRGEFGDESPSHKISDALVDFLSDRKITPPDALLEEDDDSVIVSRTQMMRAVSHIAERERARSKDPDEQGDS